MHLAMTVEAKLERPAGGAAALATLLRADHAMLRMRFEVLLSALRAGARSEATRLWFEFDGELQAHFDLEERYLLPKLELVRPAEAAAVREQHVDLRRQLERLGTGFEPDGTREAAVAAFSAALGAHAQSEEVLLHPLAECQLSERDRAAIRALLLDARSRFVARQELRRDRTPAEKRKDP